MRIAQIVCTYPPYYGGMGNVVFQTAEQLKKRGHEVVVFTPDYRNVFPEDNEPEQTREDARRLTPSFSYGNAARIPSLKNELDGFDVVHLHYPFFGTTNIVRKWKIKNPQILLVITYHMDARSDGWKGLLFSLYAKYFMNKVLDVADKIVVSSEDYAAVSDAKQHFLSHKNKWIELPFGVDTNRFFPREKPLPLFSRHNLDISIFTVVFVGGMDKAHYFKGIDYLLKALYILKKEGVEVQGVFVGGGELQAEYEMKAFGMGLKKNVRFVGKVSDEELPYYYAMGDVFCLPSINCGEAFGMVLLESIACGIPIIASDLPGVRTIAKKGGIVTSPKDSLALAKSIREFFSMGNEEREKFKILVRKRAEEHYSWDAIVEKLEAVYSEIMQK